MKNLLSCNLCGGEIEIRGKVGAILNTTCLDCGKSSRSKQQQTPKKQIIVKSRCTKSISDYQA